MIDVLSRRKALKWLRFLKVRRTLGFFDGHLDEVGDESVVVGGSVQCLKKRSICGFMVRFWFKEDEDDKKKIRRVHVFMVEELDSSRRRKLGLIWAFRRGTREFSNSFKLIGQLKDIRTLIRNSKDLFEQSLQDKERMMKSLLLLLSSSDHFLHFPGLHALIVLDTDETSSQLSLIISVTETSALWLGTIVESSLKIIVGCASHLDRSRLNLCFDSFQSRVASLPHDPDHRQVSYPHVERQLGEDDLSEVVISIFFQTLLTLTKLRMVRNVRLTAVTRSEDSLVFC
ncbi:hypothetical protein Tco_0027308 [Tanacetum coccineum]